MGVLVLKQTFHEWRVSRNLSIGFIANTLAEPHIVVQQWDMGVKFPQSRAKLFKRLFNVDPAEFEYYYEESDNNK